MANLRKDRFPYRDARRVLVVGSWAKEQITLDHLRRDDRIEVFAYVDTRNPGIAAIADACRLGPLGDVAAIVDYARAKRADLVLVTTAEPLAEGLANALEDGPGICVFGPRREAARLESDKAFARDLLARHVPEAIPAFRVFSHAAEALEFASGMDWQVAVKPIGLTDGLGVRVMGDQLRDHRDTAAYIDEVLSRGIGGESRVIVEERIQGEEFTIQCLVDGERFLPTPAVQDFKKLLPGEKGPNTASMGSYSDSGNLLPFMRQEDYDRALEVIAATLGAYRAEIGGACRGFLYGQFMLTERGIRLVEYNFRPGDPEWMNTMAVMEDSLVGSIRELLLGQGAPIRFERQATVCKYIVPEGYPRLLDQTLEVELDEAAIRSAGVDLYYSGGLDAQGKLNVGHERGIAFLAKGDTIARAERKVASAIATVGGSFYHRPDVATRELIDTKVARVARLRG